MTFEEVWHELDSTATAPIEIKTVICLLADAELRGRAVAAMPEAELMFVDPGASCFESDFKRIRESHGTIDAVLYLAAIEAPALIRDYTPIVKLFQAMAAADLKPKRCLLAGHFANEEQRCFVESWIGFERSLGMVLATTQVAVYLEESGSPDWLGRVWAEVRQPELRSTLFRNGTRSINRIRPIRPTTQRTGRLKEEGTYLITGGCGEIGLQVAKHLAQNYSAKLILTGRSALDEEHRLQLAQFASAIYLQADVCDIDGMRQAIRAAKRRFGAIHGVFHAAGVIEEESILEKEIGAFRRIIAPKISGTRVLDAVLRDEDLDFICYFSSSSAILGDFGSCDYAVANRFLMAHARSRERAFVINWPLWEGSGMNLRDDERDKLVLGSSGQRRLKPDEGLALLEQLLAQEHSQTLVIAGQRRRVHRFLGLDRTSSALATIEIPMSRCDMTGLSLEQCVETDLRRQVGDLLKIAPGKLELDVNLADLGFDSINLAQLATRLTAYFGFEVTPAVFYGYSTLKKLIGYFLNEQTAACRGFYQEGITPQAAAGPSPAMVRGTRNREEPIAVIGMSGRFPRANSVDAFWKNLKEGIRCITEAPTDRWDRRDLCETGSDGWPAQLMWGGFLNEVDHFDSLFFEITPRDAVDMDPRQRLFLEEAWHTFEDAGYMGDRIRGSSCGVYVGVEEGGPVARPNASAQINSHQNATLAARISYTLDLKGPNLALTAACSSGLVALHYACLALRAGDCSMALVGGVNLLTSPLIYQGLRRANMLSPDGKCSVFDSEANGLVPAEAVAAVLLKPLSKAISDNDHIYGCVCGSGVNYDGKTNGITAPDPLSQAQLLRTVYDRYDIKPSSIQYVMAHSIGSQLGDPVEFDALTKVFREHTDIKQVCYLGSIKPLIGHTFAASGIVGLIAMLLAMKERVVLGSATFEDSNKYIHFDKSPFTISRENQPWERPAGGPRRGAISTAGISGTNAHVVAEEYQAPTPEQPVDEIGPRVIPISARTRQDLDRYVQDFLTFLGEHVNVPLSSLAYRRKRGGRP